MASEKLAKMGLPRLSVRGGTAAGFAAMTAAVVAAGSIGTASTHRAGELARMTYDGTVVTTGYAGAAAGDFAAMRAELARSMVLRARGARDEPGRSAGRIRELMASMARDLDLVASRATGTEVPDTARRLREAARRWSARAAEAAGPGAFGDAALAGLDADATTTGRGLDLLGSQVAGEGFAYRTEAAGAVDAGVRATVGALILAVGFSAVVAFGVTRRINGPLGRAVRFADEVAAGDLAAPAPEAGRDEFGVLADSLGRMRDKIVALLESEADLQARSQARVAEALEGSDEGVLIADADGVVQVANGAAATRLGHPSGTTLEGMTLGGVVDGSAFGPEVASRLLGIGADDGAEELLVPDGRWIRSSHGRPAEGGRVVLLADTTGQRAQDEALRAALDNLAGALRAMSQGLLAFDAEGAVVLANPQVADLLGVGTDEVAVGRTRDEVVAAVAAAHAADLGPEAVARLAAHERRLAGSPRTRVRGLSLGDRHLSVSEAPMPGGGRIATVTDVTERRRVEARMNHLATHDALTDLPNRSLLRVRVEEALARARRGRPFAVHCLDLDRFKAVNDGLGHAVGDELLRQVSARLLGCVRDTDTVSRLGGDEFAILQADVSDAEGCAALARRVIDAVSAPYSIDGHAVSVGISVGAARTPTDGTDQRRLMQRADEALYASKAGGRGRFSLHAGSSDGEPASASRPAVAA